jgi:hypothetical protein
MPIQLQGSASIFFIAAVTVFCICDKTNGLELVAIEAKARLPSQLAYSTAIYDGDDNIYILGG